MKKMLYFIPTTVVFVLLVFVLIILVGPTNQLSDYLIGTAILLIFLISDWMLSKQRWYGCILGTLLGAYYLICGVITYKRQKSIS